jgi:hypothetical protein
MRRSGVRIPSAPPSRIAPHLQEQVRGGSTCQARSQCPPASQPCRAGPVLRHGSAGCHPWPTSLGRSTWKRTSRPWQSRPECGPVSRRAHAFGMWPMVTFRLAGVLDAPVRATGSSYRWPGCGARSRSPLPVVRPALPWPRHPWARCSGWTPACSRPPAYCCLRICPICRGMPVALQQCLVAPAGSTSHQGPERGPRCGARRSRRPRAFQPGRWTCMTTPGPPRRAARLRARGLPTRSRGTDQVGSHQDSSGRTGPPPHPYG